MTQNVVRVKIILIPVLFADVNECEQALIQILCHDKTCINTNGGFNCLCKEFVSLPFCSNQDDHTGINKLCYLAFVVCC